MVIPLFIRNLFAFSLHPYIPGLITLLQYHPWRLSPIPRGSSFPAQGFLCCPSTAWSGAPSLPSTHMGRGFQSTTQMQQFPSMRIPNILFSAENAFPCEQEGGQCKECTQRGLKGVAQASVTNAGRKKCSLFCSQVG